jgi:NADPH-dependent ferric siderophore reductase
MTRHVWYYVKKLHLIQTHVDQYQGLEMAEIQHVLRDKSHEPAFVRGAVSSICQKCLTVATCRRTNARTYTIRQVSTGANAFAIPYYYLVDIDLTN